MFLFLSLNVYVVNNSFNWKCSFCELIDSMNKVDVIFLGRIKEKFW